MQKSDDYRFDNFLFDNFYALSEGHPVYTCRKYDKYHCKSISRAHLAYLHILHTICAVHATGESFRHSAYADRQFNFVTTTCHPVC